MEKYQTDHFSKGAVIIDIGINDNDTRFITLLPNDNQDYSYTLEYVLYYGNTDPFMKGMTLKNLFISENSILDYEEWDSSVGSFRGKKFFSRFNFKTMKNAHSFEAKEIQFIDSLEEDEGFIIFPKIEDNTFYKNIKMLKIKF